MLDNGGIVLSKLHEKDVKLKKDWVTYFAVTIYVLIVCSEVALVVFLPMQLRSEKAWERDAALDKMISLEDLLRAYLIDFKDDYRQHFDKGNAELIKKCLDDNARYIRTYREQMDREQIREIYRYLKRFDKIIYKLTKKKINIKFEKIDPRGYINYLHGKSKNKKIEYPYIYRQR